MVTSVRQETHIPDELADTLADRTYQVTYPWCGIIREDVVGTQNKSNNNKNNQNIKRRGEPRSMRQHKLADRTYQATYPWCGIIREDIVCTHKDTHAPGSHSRY